MKQFDVAVIGGGIAGLAHAWMAARRGHSVLLIDRDLPPRGASVRNFGMIWPIGQPQGERHQIARRSRQLWLELAHCVRFWINECGSFHLAHRDDEWKLLEEYSEQAHRSGHPVQLLSPAEILPRSQAANPDGLRGGLWSPTELCVNPREIIRKIPIWLRKEFGVELQFGTHVSYVDAPQLIASDGRAWRAQRIILCNGADLQTLFPDELAKLDLITCKLQMLSTAPQPKGWRLGPHLASGLTLRHYANFADCPSLGNLKQRIAQENPELDRFGIHVMASQIDAGRVILGDSHEYGEQIEPFDKMRIEELILRELRRIIRLPSWSIAHRWHGVYVKHATKPHVVAHPQPNVTIVTGLGGAGMTLAFGLAESMWETSID